MSGEQTSDALAGLRHLISAAAVVGGLIPGASYFVSAAPPDFEVLPLLTGAVALAIVLRGLRSARTPSRGPGPLPLLLGAFALLVLYGAMLDMCTVPPRPGWEGPRVQIGFHLADWSLTARGRETLAVEDLSTPAELLLGCGYYEDPGAVFVCWEPWSVFAASSMLVLLFSSGYLLWAYACARLARDLIRTRGGSS